MFLSSSSSSPSVFSLFKSGVQRLFWGEVVGVFCLGRDGKKAKEEDGGEDGREKFISLDFFDFSTVTAPKRSYVKSEVVE